MSWPVVGLALALTAPRLVAEFRDGWHTSSSTEAESDAESRRRKS